VPPASQDKPVTAVRMAFQVLLASLVQTDNLEVLDSKVIEAKMVQPGHLDPLELTVNKVLLATLGQMEVRDRLETPEHREQQDSQDQVDNKVLGEHKEQLVMQVQRDVRDPLAVLVLPVKLVLLDLLELRVIYRVCLCYVRLVISEKCLL